jgi:hypothetical protein
MSATTDDARNSAEAEITKNAALAVTETAKEAKAKKIVTRLEEAYNNNKTLANLAEELANAKANTDEIIDNLVQAGADLQAEIDGRMLSRTEAFASIDQNVYALQNTDPTDKTAVAKINAAIDSLNTLIVGKDESDNNARRLMKEYSFQQVQVNNQYRITQAKLQAEIVNAEFSVNLKEKLNIKEDLEEIEIEVNLLLLAKEVDGADTDALQGQIDALNGRKGDLQNTEGQLQSIIGDLKTTVSTSKALALSIGSIVATEEANLRLSTATNDLTTITERLKKLDAAVLKETFFMNSGADKVKGQ